MRLYRGSPFVCSYTSRPVSKTGFLATVLKFFGTSPLFTMHQPGLPGIRYSFPVEYSSANSFKSSLLFSLSGSMIFLSKMFSNHSSLTPIVPLEFSFFFISISIFDPILSTQISAVPGCHQCSCLASAPQLSDTGSSLPPVFEP